ncbi:MULTISPECIES: glycerate kinase [Bacteria]|uniref:glycerate kinase n=1 Tax=Bacteria TaxID=2 RepID=UPI003C7B1E9C
MTTVVIALDSFKGTIGAAAATAAVAAGWTSVERDAIVRQRPMADGGEGTIEAFAAAHPAGVRMSAEVDGPEGSPVTVSWLRLPGYTGLPVQGEAPVPTDAQARTGAPGDTAVIDLASTSGIQLLSSPRPLDADSRGFGQAIAAALDHGVTRLILGIGSSASTDGGTGMLRALGGRFLDADGEEIAPGARGLLDLEHVDLSGLRPAPDTLVLTDVVNPLTGPRGAAEVFGPQKGLADPAERRRVDEALLRLAALCGLDESSSGAGAAGGVGGALMVWGARLVPGAAEVARLIGLREAVAGADLVITGEGAFDGQSADGKAPSFVASLAAEAGAPVVLVAGRVQADPSVAGFCGSVSLSDLAGGDAAASADPARWLTLAGARLAADLGQPGRR